MQSWLVMDDRHRPASAKRRPGGIMILPATWMPLLGDELIKPYFRDLHQFLAAEKTEHQIFPSPERVFTAFELTPFEQARVVILGQDPYHDVGQAHGLAFSVLPGVKLPGS